MNNKKTLSDAFIKQYNGLIDLLNIDYDDYRSAYATAVCVSKYNWELALRIMINIIASKPIFFEEQIRDSIIIDVEAEGNINTYNYLLHMIKLANDKDVILSLADMKELVELKYGFLELEIRR